MFSTFFKKNFFWIFEEQNKNTRKILKNRQKIKKAEYIQRLRDSENI